MVWCFMFNKGPNLNIIFLNRHGKLKQFLAKCAGNVYEYGFTNDKNGHLKIRMLQLTANGTSTEVW